MATKTKQQLKTRARRAAGRVGTGDMVRRFRGLAKDMRDHATYLRTSGNWARPDLDGEREASAQSAEFWAKRVEETLQA